MTPGLLTSGLAAGSGGVVGVILGLVGGGARSSRFRS